MLEALGKVRCLLAIVVNLLQDTNFSTKPATACSPRASSRSTKSGCRQCDNEQELRNDGSVAHFVLLALKVRNALSDTLIHAKLVNAH